MQHVVSVHIGFMQQAPNTAVQVRRAGLPGARLPAAAEHAYLRESHSIRCMQHAEPSHMAAGSRCCALHARPHRPTWAHCSRAWLWPHSHTPLASLAAGLLRVSPQPPRQALVESLLLLVRCDACPLRRAGAAALQQPLLLLAGTLQAWELLQPALGFHIQFHSLNCHRTLAIPHCSGPRRGGLP